MSVIPGLVGCESKSTYAFGPFSHCLRVQGLALGRSDRRRFALKDNRLLAAPHIAGHCYLDPQGIWNECQEL